MNQSISKTDNSANPLRILVIAPTPFFSDRGCHIRINEECQALLERGHKMKILTYGLGKDVPNLDIERIHHFPSYTKTSAGPSFFKLFLDLLLFFRTIRRIRSFRPDIIHAHLHEGMCIAWAARLCTFSRILILFDAQGSLVSELRNHLRTMPQIFFAFTNKIEKFIFRLSDTAVVSSDSLRKLIVAQHLAPSSLQITLATDSANPVPLLTADEKKNLRTEYHISDNDTVAVYCGGMTADKGTDLLYEAIAPLLKTTPSLKMLWIGGPDTPLSVRALQDGIQQQMIFCGSKPFEETHRLSQLGTIAIDPKPPTSSQASGKVLNYMAIALPIIIFDSENREMVDPANFFAAPATATGLQDALRRAIQTPHEELARIGQKNVVYLDIHFSWKATAEVLEGVYRKMLQD